METSHWRDKDPVLSGVLMVLTCERVQFCQWNNDCKLIAYLYNVLNIIKWYYSFIADNKYLTLNCKFARSKDDPLNFPLCISLLQIEPTV
jgi:hypothetical protein